MQFKAIRNTIFALALAAGAAHAKESAPRISITVDGTTQERRGGIIEADVRVIMPDGRRLVVACTTFRRWCYALNRGDDYPAEVHGNDLWIFAKELNGKEKTGKYQVTGEW
jgi:hypothetical protein